MKVKFPKYLVELDQEDTMGDWPSTPLWVARTRDPFVMARINLTETAFEMHTWPAVFEGDRRKLADKLAHALLREYDMYPGDLPEPKLLPYAVEPPEFINMVRPDSEAEFILEPYAPRLWKVHVKRNMDTSGVEWINGFGSEPTFPEDLRRVTNFINE